MNDLLMFKKVMRIARSLHITIDEVEEVINNMMKFRNEVNQSQQEAAAMVDEMMD